MFDYAFACKLSYKALQIARDYTSLAIAICEDIRAGKIDIDPSLVDKVFIKNSEEKIRNNISAMNGYMDLSAHRYLSDINGEFENFISILNSSAEFLSDFSNTILFRNYTNNKGRKICTVNSKFNDEYKSKIYQVFKLYEKTIYSIYYSRNCFSYGRSDDEIPRPYIFSIKDYSFRKGLSAENAVSNAVSHVSNHNSRYVKKHVVSFDVKKFFPSLTTEKFFENNIFHSFFKDFLTKSWGSSIWDSASPILEELKPTKTPLRYRIAHSPGDTYFINLFRNRIVSRERLFSRLAIIYTLLLDSFMHNGRIPTGACYSPILSNLYMHVVNKEITKDLTAYLSNNYEHECRAASSSNSFVTVFRYVDDFTLLIHDFRRNLINGDLMSIVKKIEEVMNRFGLYLNYEKTKFYKTDENGKLSFSMLGRTVTCIGGRGNSRVNSKFRREVIDIVLSKHPSEYNSSDIGKINYCFNSSTTLIDILMHLDFEKKEQAFRSKFNMNYKTFITLFKNSQEIKSSEYFETYSDEGFNNSMFMQAAFCALGIDQEFKDKYGIDISPTFECPRRDGRFVIAVIGFPLRTSAREFDFHMLPSEELFSYIYNCTGAY